MSNITKRKKEVYYHGDFGSTTNFEVSPDGLHIFNGAGYILRCSADMSSDMVKIRDLDTSFDDIAFDLADNTYYLATAGSTIKSYDYDTHEFKETFTLQYNPERVFLTKDAILALTKSNGTYYFERLSALISVAPDASVKKLSGKQNELTVVINEIYSDGSTSSYCETFLINNNSAGKYAVGGYTVYVNIKGGTQIRDCYIIE